MFYGTFLFVLFFVRRKLSRFGYRNSYTIYRSRSRTHCRCRLFTLRQFLQAWQLLAFGLFTAAEAESSAVAAFVTAAHPDEEQGKQAFAVAEFIEDTVEASAAATRYE